MVKTESKRKVVKIRRRHPPGTAPGQVIAPARGAPPSVQLIAYSATDVVDLHDIELADGLPLIARPGIIEPGRL